VLRGWAAASDDHGALTGARQDDRVGSASLSLSRVCLRLHAVT